MDTKNVNKQLVFDLGMNICEDTDFYLRKGFRVIAVDANPALCREASARYAREIDENRLVVLNHAIAPHAGSIVFYVCKEMSAWSTTVPQLRDFWAASGATFEAIQVEAVTGMELLSRFGVPYYAKVDIEGQDLNFLRGLVAFGATPTHLSFEVDFGEALEAIKICERLGYVSFSLMDQKEVAGQRPPNPAREGHQVEFAFRQGCTGLFGREFPGRWVDAYNIRWTSRKIIWKQLLAGLLTRAMELTNQGRLAERIKRTEPFRPIQTWYDMHASTIPHNEAGEMRAS